MALGFGGITIVALHIERRKLGCEDALDGPEELPSLKEALLLELEQLHQKPRVWSHEAATLFYKPERVLEKHLSRLHQVGDDDGR